MLLYLHVDSLVRIRTYQKSAVKKTVCLRFAKPAHVLDCSNHHRGSSPVAEKQVGCISYLNIYDLTFWKRGIQKKACECFWYEKCY